MGRKRRRCRLKEDGCCRSTCPSVCWPPHSAPGVSVESLSSFLRQNCAVKADDLDNNDKTFRKREASQRVCVIVCNKEQQLEQKYKKTTQSSLTMGPSFSHMKYKGSLKLQDTARTKDRPNTSEHENGSFKILKISKLGPLDERFIKMWRSTIAIKFFHWMVYSAIRCNPCKFLWLLGNFASTMSGNGKSDAGTFAVVFTRSFSKNACTGNASGYRNSTLLLQHYLGLGTRPCCWNYGRTFCRFPLKKPCVVLTQLCDRRHCVHATDALVSGNIGNNMQVLWRPQLSLTCCGFQP